MMSNSNKERKTPYGLYNQGMTCYLNSVLQLLFMTPHFGERLDPNKRTDQELKTLFENLKKGSCGTESITKSFQIQDVHKQHDVTEYLDLILNRISQRASKIFCGMMSYSTICCQGHSINEETKTFWTLPLPLKNQINGVFTVNGGLDRIFTTQKFTGERKVYCKDCGRNTDADYKCETKDFPQVLVLLLKRFEFDHNTSSYFKSNCAVDIPTTLSMKTVKYDLYGIVHHWGGLSGGHYTATIRSSNDKTWYKFNDDSVERAKDPPSDIYSSSDAYLLAYTKDPPTTHEGIQPEPPVTRPPFKPFEIDQRPRPPSTHRSKIILIVGGVMILVIIFVLGLTLGLTRKKGN